MSSFCFAAHALWHLGYPEQALKRSQAAVALAREVSHPYSLAYALGNAAWFHQLCREPCATQERAEATVALSTEQGFAYWSAYGTIMRGWALAEQGKGEEGIAQMRQGLSAWHDTGTELFRPFWLARLAEAYGKVGRAEEGLKVLAEVLTTVSKTGERFYEAELYRLKGELTLLAQSSVQRLASSVQTPQSTFRNLQSEAEACFHKAIEIARHQGAKSLELRAVMSLSCLWQQQGKKKQARQMLAKSYGWFTEGFDTADLKEAKAQLEELAGTRTE
jgi:predicted ATPase